MAAIVTVEPTSEPVTLDEVKLHLRVDHSDDDDLITGYIVSARRKFERETNRSLVPRTYRLDINRFPCNNGQIRLPNGPVLAVDSLTYIDYDDSVITVDADDYIVDLTPEVATLTPIITSYWPIAYPRPGAVSVTYVAGYGTLDDDEWTPAIPADAKVAIYLLIADLYDNRDGTGDMPRAAKNMLDSLHITQLA